MPDPHQCPLEVVFNISEGLIPDVENHAEPDRALGVIAFRRSVLGQAREELHCEGASIDNDGHLRCPLEAVVMAVNQSVMGKVNPQNVAADYSVFANNAKTSNGHTGQYL